MPALPVALGLATGVSASLITTDWWVSLIAIGLGITLWIWQKYWLSAICLCSAAGLWVAIGNLPAELPASFTDRECTIRAIVKRSSEKPNNINYIIETESIKFNRQKAFSYKMRLQFTDYAHLEPFANGSKISIKGLLEPFDNGDSDPFKPDMSTYQRVEKLSGIFVQKDETAKLIAPPTSFVDIFSNKCSAYLKDAIVNTGYDEPTTRFLLATLSGDDMLLDSEKISSYRSAGLAHLLALSGLHTGIIYGILSLMLWWVKSIPGCRPVYFSTIAVFVLIYALATGFTPSVARAAMMVCVVSLVKIINGWPQPSNILCITIIVWLLYNPMWLFSPSFQMSVAAVTAIIWVNNLTKNFDREHRLQHKIILIFAIPLAAMSATAALTAFYFKTFPTYFLIANVLITFPATIVIAGGAICTMLSTCGFPVAIFTKAIDIVYSVIENIVTNISTWPNAQIEGLQPSIYQYIAYISLLICVVWCLQYKRRAAVYAIFLLVGGLTVSFTMAPRPIGDEAYILGRQYFNTILIRHNDTITIVGKTDSIQQKTLTYRLHQYVINNGCKQLQFQNRDYSAQHFAKHGMIIKAHGKNIIYINDNHPFNVTGKPDYAYVGPDWRGEIIPLSRSVHADTIIISEGINKRRRERYIQTLKQIGQPAKSAPAQIAP